MTELDVNFPQFKSPLSQLGARLAFDLMQSLEKSLHQSPQAQALPVQIVTQDTLRQAEPTCRFNLLCRTAAGTLPAWLEFSPTLADAFIDMLLGSKPRPLAQCRHSLTAVDRNLLRSIVERIAQSFSQILAPAGLSLDMPQANAGSLEDVLVTQQNPSAMAEASPMPPSQEMLVDLPIKVVVGPCQGKLRLLLPTGLLKELCPEILPTQAMMQISASIEDVQIDSRELEHLNPGDVVVTDAGAGGEVIVHVEGVPRFAGQLGQHTGRRAIVVTRKLDS